MGLGPILELPRRSSVTLYTIWIKVNHRKSRVEKDPRQNDAFSYTCNLTCEDSAISIFWPRPFCSAKLQALTSNSRSLLFFYFCQICGKAKKIVYCGGPFTDGLRQLSEGKDVKPMVNASGGALTKTCLTGSSWFSCKAKLSYNVRYAHCASVAWWQ